MRDVQPHPVAAQAVPSTRKAFASQVFAAAHEVLTLRDLLRRAERDDVQSLADVRQLVLTMIAERGRFMAGDHPDAASDVLEAAAEDRRHA